MIGQFIKHVDTHEMGGNVTVDLVHLPDGRVLGVTDECVVLYASIDDFLSGGTSDAPTIDLLEHLKCQTQSKPRYSVPLSASCGR